MDNELLGLKLWMATLRPWVDILLIWALAWLSLRLIRRTLRTLRTHIVEHRTGQNRDARRIETLMNVFRYTANVVIIGIAVMLTLGAIGISVTPLLATAGVAGIAVGFGAQSLVKDFFTGLFLLIENQVSEGDVIEAAGKSGFVERVTLRHIRIRDYDGSVHFIPNGMITTVTNRSRDFAYAVIDLNVRRQDNLDEVFGTMRAISAALRADPVTGPLILEDIDIGGVEQVADAAVTLRCRIKVMPGKQWRVRREFLRRMKLAIDEVKETEAAS
ncbi:MAG TPA: mechanosensitive ion channel domain-containing protein [Noviherbaspirillum sp.]|jgi:small conductance mechanosensitive channel|uniref:mechanosensitive ion channel family protein n=1 Tax=Noviherbaspirillum sp. TaxID=1926288 RepID=UPI002F948F84